MKSSRGGTLGAAVVLFVLVAVCAFSMGPLPALGPFLDPVHGVAGSVRHAELETDASVTLPGLKADTRVVYDDRRVPHIFAPNMVDAYRALGYVVARDRLFQIELQARAGAGTLTEFVGVQGLSVDFEAHRLGMPFAAERRMANYDTTTASWAFVRAYGDGVNAYIDGLKPADYPFEYKLLGASPRRWQPIDMLHLLNRMGQTLATSSDEMVQLEASAVVGRAAAQALYPLHSPIVEPIQPNGQSVARVDEVHLPPPGKPDSSALAIVKVVERKPRKGLTISSNDALENGTAAGRSDDRIGSNNWAVAPSRSASGIALLAGDPHLELTLPSIWYEVHLVVPDSLDVYGVTIPGAPGVVIGFNRSVAWTFTNTGADVADYYLEDVSGTPPNTYRVDSVYKPLIVMDHEYRLPNGSLVNKEHLMFTHRGPLQLIGNRWMSMRWTVLESGRDFEAFLAASRATSAQGLLDAMAQSYGAPAQNMLAADTGGTIAIRSTGRYPMRPDNGRGDWPRDGSTSQSDWTGNWTLSEYPQAFNPPQGFLVSANQEPLDPRVQPRYLGSNWERPWRAMRINSLLRADSAVTPDAMRRYQSDPGSARAEWFVPAFLNAATHVAATQKLARAAALLGEWDRRYTKENTCAVLFEEAMTQLPRRLWDELRTDPSVTVRTPSDMITAMLLNDSTSVWWDDQRTPMAETRDELLAQVLESALDSVTARYGAPDSVSWRWDHVRFANIYHLLQIPGLSRQKIPVQGGPATIWPSSGNGRHGPSWRMVVELGKTPRAWGTYPGGQSGNPLSAHYDDRIDQWSRGELDTLRVPHSAGDLTPAMQSARLVLTPAGGKK